jgi:hypothetical protein
MRVLLRHPRNGKLLLQADAEGPGGMLGDLTKVLGPGDEFIGWTYEALLALGPGGHEIERLAPQAVSRTATL